MPLLAPAELASAFTMLARFQDTPAAPVPSTAIVHLMYDTPEQVHRFGQEIGVDVETNADGDVTASARLLELGVRAMYVAPPRLPDMIEGERDYADEQANARELEET